MPQNKHENKTGGKIEEQARLCVEDIINNAGYKIWDIIFEKEGAMWYLRILFDTPQSIENPAAECGISSEECEKITAPINAAIDKQVFLNKIDILEIGSPGLTRKLRCADHFRACEGQLVCAALRGENGKTIYKKGILGSYDNETGTVFIDNEPIIIKKCIKINLDI